MKKQTYTLQVTCNAYQFSKIQRFIKELLPKKNKPERLIEQYGKQCEKLIKQGYKPKHIYKVIKNTRNETQDSVTIPDIYALINNMGYKRTYTKNK
jgi:dsRNA-specific ribonuclease